MSLKEQLFNDLKTAMKEKDTVRKEVIQIVRAGVLQIEKDQKIDNLDDDSVLTVISKEIKKINDVMPDFEKAQRQDLIDEANKKIELLKAYLPEQLSEAEIEEIVAETIKNVGAVSVRDMGKVMGSVTAKTKGKADNRLVSDVVKKMLQNL
ncbi:MAG: GatB/YqeY domain-containing protein [Clostridia bacterium]|nr:GatB/YqeY domain-containing protein [Clostridia bacterium]